MQHFCTALKVYVRRWCMSFYHHSCLHIKDLAEKSNNLQDDRCHLRQSMFKAWRPIVKGHGAILIYLLCLVFSLVLHTDHACFVYIDVSIYSLQTGQCIHSAWLIASIGVSAEWQNLYLLLQQFNIRHCAPHTSHELLSIRHYSCLREQLTPKSAWS